MFSSMTMSQLFVAGVLVVPIVAAGLYAVGRIFAQRIADDDHPPTGGRARRPGRRGEHTDPPPEPRGDARDTPARGPAGDAPVDPPGSAPH